MEIVIPGLPTLSAGRTRNPDLRLFEAKAGFRVPPPIKLAAAPE